MELPVITPKLCTSRFCDKELIGSSSIWCSDICNRLEQSARAKDRKESETYE